MGGATRGGTAESTSRDQIKRKKRGQRKEVQKTSHKKEEFLARKRRRRGRTERRLVRQKKKGIEHVRVDGRLQLSRITYGRWRWIGRMESNERSMF